MRFDAKFIFLILITIHKFIANFNILKIKFFIIFINKMWSAWRSGSCVRAGLRFFLGLGNKSLAKGQRILYTPKPRNKTARPWVRVPQGQLSDNVFFNNNENNNEKNQYCHPTRLSVKAHDFFLKNYKKEFNPKHRSGRHLTTSRRSHNIVFDQ